jgi:hypothetical protein
MGQACFFPAVIPNCLSAPAPVMEVLGWGEGVPKRPKISHGMEWLLSLMPIWIASTYRPWKQFLAGSTRFPLHRRDYLPHILISGRRATIFAAVMPLLLLIAKCRRP